MKKIFLFIMMLVPLFILPGAFADDFPPGAPFSSSISSCWSVILSMDSPIPKIMFDPEQLSSNRVRQKQFILMGNCAKCYRQRNDSKMLNV